MGYGNRLLSHPTQSYVVKETNLQLGKPMGVTIFCHPELNPFLNTTDLPCPTGAGMSQMSNHIKAVYVHGTNHCPDRQTVRQDCVAPVREELLALGF